MGKSTKVILSFIREIVFGLEDGLVSTLGAITGIAGATNQRPIVIVSGLVIIAVESLSMAAGTYLSNKTEIQAQNLHRQKNAKTTTKPTIDGLFMGASYITGGIVPLVPYLILPISSALIVSIILTALTLFAIGAYKGRLIQDKPIINGLEMMIISLAAAALGYTIGRLAAVFFPNISTY